MGDDNIENDEWETVISKKSVKKEKRDIQRQKLENQRKTRDLRYLQTHVGFQKHRITRQKALDILEGYKIRHPDINTGSLFIVSNGRCVGHLISVAPLEQTCLQCDWTSTDGLVAHCCCTDDVVNLLPPNFYLGCDGYLNDYLLTMKEPPLDL